MGMGESIIEQSVVSTVSDENMNQLSIYQDKRFGQVTILQQEKPEKKLYLRKKVKYSSQEEVKAIREEIRLRKELGAFYCKIESSKVKKVDKLCLQEFSIHVTIEYSKDSLRSEIKKRKSSGIGFQIEELFQIFHSMVRFGAFLCDSKEREKMFGPDVVMLHSNGNVSILESKFLRPNFDNYKRIMALTFESVKPDKWALLAPEELAMLISRENKPEFDSDKIHAFAIGVSILCALTCQNEDYFYDLTKLTFLREKALDILDKSDLHFEFIKVLKLCIFPLVKQRIGCKDLLSICGILKSEMDMDSNIEEVMFKKNLNNISTRYT